MENSAGSVSFHSINGSYIYLCYPEPLTQKSDQVLEQASKQVYSKHTKPQALCTPPVTEVQKGRTGAFMP